MRIQFIYPNLNAEEGFNHGIASLAGALKAAGHELRLLNLNEALAPIPSCEQIIETIRGYRPQLIAWSVMTQQYPYALSTARRIKAALPQIPQAIGGVHVTLCTEQVIADDFWDIIGVGECDEAIVELAEKIQRGTDYSNVPNMIVRLTDGSYRRNPLGPYPDLKKLPPKDYEIFELDEMLEKKNGWQSVLTSRGCPYRCSYCFNYEFAQRYRRETGQTVRAYLRRYDIGRIIDEIKQLKRRHPAIETIIFDDDLFTLEKDYVLRFCHAYVAAGIELPFVINAHVQVFDEQIAEALARTPCRIVKFGVESGSPWIRSHILDRHMSNQAIIDAFALCENYGLHSSAFVMLGLPHETPEMLRETIQLIAHIRPGRMRWSMFYPFPGTRIHRLCERDGLIDQAKMQTMENYFVASCLKFDPQTDLLLRKLQRCFHWYVNAAAGLGPASEFYAQKVAEIEQLDAAEWHRHAEAIPELDRRMSEQLLQRGWRHYSLRYTEVMAVDSEYILAERGRHKYKPVRRWRAFRCCNGH